MELWVRKWFSKDPDARQYFKDLERALNINLKVEHERAQRIARAKELSGVLRKEFDLPENKRVLR